MTDRREDRGTHLFPETSRTCSSVAWDSSEGILTSRFSRTQNTLRPWQPPIYAGQTGRRHRQAARAAQGEEQEVPRLGLNEDRGIRFNLLSVSTLSKDCRWQSS